MRNATGFIRQLSTYACVPLAIFGAIGAAQACPALQDELLTRPTSNLVEASIIDNGSGSFAYSLVTSDQSPVNSVPGVIEYCVYSGDGAPYAGPPGPSTPWSPVAPASWAVDAGIAAIWQTTSGVGYFGFGRQQGTDTIPMNGTTVTVGSAQFSTLPANQFILLHISDLAECQKLYPGATDADGSLSSTCFVQPGTIDTRPPEVTIGGAKYYDANANGVLDGTEVELLNFKVTVTFPNSDMSPQTLSAPWSLTLPVGTAYRVCEVAPVTTWVQTGPSPLAAISTPPAAADAGRCWNGTVSTNGDELDFGNVCVGNGGGLTLGFWSNKNGQNLIANDLSGVSTLNLANASSCLAAPKFSGYTAFRSWLLNASATNMAYMLSVQMATMYLNTTKGTVAGSTKIYAPSLPAACGAFADTSKVVNGFISATDLIALANSLVPQSSCNTVGGSTLRTCEEQVKNALDGANNNLNFVVANPQTCPAPYPPQ